MTTLAVTPPITPTLQSRLPQVGTTIFTVMSALAAEKGAVNLGQGFPDFGCDRALTGAVTEAMNARRPVVIPRHTSLEHLGGENGQRAYFLETLYPTVAMVDNIIRFQCDLYEISDTLDQVKRDIDSKSPALRQKLDEAERFVSKLDWNEISKTFSDAIKALK